MCKSENTAGASGAGAPRIDTLRMLADADQRMRDELSLLRKVNHELVLEVRMVRDCLHVAEGEIDMLKAAHSANEFSSPRIEEVISALRDACAFASAKAWPIEACAEAVERWTKAIRMIRGG